MTKDWYPHREAERWFYLQNFVANTADATALLKLPAAAFKAATDAAQAELDAFDQRDSARKALDTAQTVLNTQDTATEAAVRAAAKQIKGTMNVPQEVLDLLELNPPAGGSPARPGADGPVLKAAMDGIHPSIGCAKHGFDAVEIWCQRAPEPEPTRLATVTHLPYFDNRPNAAPAQAEQRNYFAYYLLKNEVASAQSATTALLVPGGTHA